MRGHVSVKKEPDMSHAQSFLRVSRKENNRMRNHVLSYFPYSAVVRDATALRMLSVKNWYRLIIVLGLMFTSFGVSFAGTPSISWQSEKIDVTIARGEITIIEVLATSDVPLTDVSVSGVVECSTIGHGGHVSCPLFNLYRRALTSDEAGHQDCHRQ